jgi:hypothetical protein
MSTAEIIAELPKLSAAELAAVQAKPRELAGANVAGTQVAAHPALGFWKDRTDLPQDSIEASKLLRERMMRADAAE